MKDFIQILEVIVLSVLLIFILYFAYIFMSNESLKVQNIKNTVGPIIKLNIEKENINSNWEYEIEDKAIIKVEKHSEVEDDGTRSIRYVIVPKNEGESMITFKLVDDKTNESISKKSYNIRVTDLGYGNFSANIVE